MGAARAAATGSLTLGELAAYVLQAIALVGVLGTIAEEADFQTKHGLRAFEGLEQIERAAAESADEKGTARRHRYAALGDPLRARDVRIRRDATGLATGADDPCGALLTIVGLNGAGKTTLVKLLARLHEPQGGRIVVDGIEFREYTVRERRRLGAIFQDFVHYALPVRENVGFGAPELLHDDARCVPRSRVRERCNSSRRCRTGWRRRSRASTTTEPTSRAASGNALRSRALWPP